MRHNIKIVGLKTSGKLLQKAKTASGATKSQNAQHSINCNGDVVIRDCSFDQDGYNCLEIGLNKAYNPSNVTIENCNFTGSLSNNAILIFGTQDNATITIKNCTFKDVSNAVRLSNKTNATGINVVFENCKVESWDKTPAWAGFLILEDYTTKYVSADDCAATANLFAPEKMQITFKNCYGPYGKIEGDPKDFCSTVDTESQIVYIWNNYEKAGNKSATVAYDETRFPKIVCE
jgi:hypothetical protein